MVKELNYFFKIISSNFGRLTFPHKISYILTYRCNLRCKMCDIWNKKVGQELTLEEIERFLKISNQFSWIGITGGEPFLREDISEVVKIILDNCKELVAIHFATNGTMTEKIIKVAKNALKNTKRKINLLFTLSIDGPEYLHDRIRGRDGVWNKCTETFKKLKEIKFVKPRIGITLSQDNLDKFKETFISLKKISPLLRFDDITVNIFHRSSFYYNNIPMPELISSEVVEAIDTILNMDKDTFTINNFLRRKYLKLYKRYLENQRCPLKCQALSATCVLDPQGDIYPCGIYGIKIANIKEYNYDFKKLWSDSRIKEISMQCSKGICPSCWSPCDAYSAITGSLFRFNLWNAK